MYAIRSYYATPQALKYLHRSFDRERFDHVCRLLNQYGITYGIDLIYALPGDSHETFVASLDYALSQRPNQLDIFPLSVLPGTELYRITSYNVCYTKLLRDLSRALPERLQTSAREEKKPTARPRV